MNDCPPGAWALPECHEWGFWVWGSWTEPRGGTLSPQVGKSLKAYCKFCRSCECTLCLKKTSRRF